MIVKCTHGCGLYFDDAAHSTVCPHNELGGRPIMIEPEAQRPKFHFFAVSWQVVNLSMGMVIVHVERLDLRQIIDAAIQQIPTDAEITAIRRLVKGGGPRFLMGLSLGHGIDLRDDSSPYPPHGGRT